MPGFRSITVPAAADDPAVRGAVWYPCAEAPAAVDLGNVTKLFGITLTGAKDAPITGYMLPLVVVSHGRRSHLVMHHDLAETLADGGFIVAAINHVGDNYFDQSRSAELSVMLQRPTEIKRLIDFMLTASPLAATIDRERIGVFGFSRGGHTGLALLGANPDWADRSDYLWKPSSEWQKQVRDPGFPRRDIAHDSRIRAGVIADPLAAFFTESSFADVAASIQLWASERGGDGVGGCGTMLHSARIGSGEAKRWGANGETKFGGPRPAGQHRRSSAWPAVFGAEFFELCPYRHKPALEDTDDLTADLGSRESGSVYKPTPTIDLILRADDDFIGIAIHGDKALGFLNLLHQFVDCHGLGLHWRPSPGCAGLRRCVGLGW